MLPVCPLLCTGTHPWQVLSPVHSLSWSLSGGCSEGDCVSLASKCSVFLGPLWRGDGESCVSFGRVCAAFADSWNILVREHLWYFLSGAACLPLERPKRHQKALIFKAFLGKDITILCFLPYSRQSLSYKNKQIAWWVACIQHLAKLDQFAKCWYLFSWMT